MGCCLHFEWNSWWNFMASNCLQISPFNYGMPYDLFVSHLLHSPLPSLVDWDLSSVFSSCILANILRYILQASILVLALFSLSSSQPLHTQISLRRREPQEFETMGQALGIPDSGLLLQTEAVQVIDPNEPLDKLLLDKRFRQSFMKFADRFRIPPQAPVFRNTFMRIYFLRKLISWETIPGVEKNFLKLNEDGKTTLFPCPEFHGD